MKKDEKPEVPTGCLFQGCYNPAYEAEIKKGKDLCYRFNALNPNDRDAQTEILAELLGGMGKDVIFTPPFWCDYGYNITVGDTFYANHNLVITDGAAVTFGDNVFIAPNCCFTTAEHPTDPEQRKAGLEIAKPITVGNNVWIGAGSVVLAGGHDRRQCRDRRGFRRDARHSVRCGCRGRAVQSDEKDYGRGQVSLSVV